MNGIDPALLWSGAAIGAAGAAVAFLHKLPGKAWAAITHLVTVSVEVRDQDLVKWIGVTAIDRWGLASRRTSAILKTRRDFSEVALEPARGHHLLRWRRRLVVIDRGKEEPGGLNMNPAPSVETVTLRGFGRDPSWLKSMILEAAEYGQAKFLERSPVRISTSYGDWVDLAVGEARSLDSVVLPGDLREELRGALRRFLGAAEWYAVRGVPWRLGIAIFGPPGSGKSSLARALCGEFGLPLHIVDLSSKSITDGTLLTLLANVGGRAAVMLDDLDASKLPDRDSTSGGVTLSGLLGAMDGPGAAEGRVLFVCSNRPEKMDEALLREGRIDITITLGPATRQQARDIYLLWHPGSEADAEAFAADGEGQSMATLQGRLMSAGTPRRRRLELVPEELTA